jgi:hypothetical protein
MAAELVGRREGPALEPGDVWRAGRLCAEALRPVPAAVWPTRAAGLAWTCDYTLRHTIRCLDAYAIRMACRDPDGVAPLPMSPPEYPGVRAEALLTLLEGRAAILARVAEGTPPEMRVFHSYGNGDPVGMAGMGCVELLVHTDDIARAAGLPFRPPAELGARVVRRMFPWAPAEAAPWDALRWATGRLDLPDREGVGPDWIWHSAPLHEWDGRHLTEPPAPR